MTETEIWRLFSRFVDPFLQEDWVTAKIMQIKPQQSGWEIHVNLGYPFQDIEQDLVSHVQDFLSREAPETKVIIKFAPKILSHRVQQANLRFHPQVKNVIAVASGKGGVGKSTTALNLALALQQQGATVGILDADIHGPNQPLMLGITQQPNLKSPEGLMPLSRYGLQTMSIGYLVDTKTPVIWRGPMISQALQQLYYETEWQNLDYLVMDLPPGTGDIQLTLSQKIPVTGAVIVTTPQEVAIADARKAFAMFQKMQINVLGVIENMSGYVCSHCGEHEHIFGKGGGLRLSQEMQSELLGVVPLTKQIQEQSDRGIPISKAFPQGEITKLYNTIARRIAVKIALLPKNHNSKLPNVIVE